MTRPIRLCDVFALSRDLPKLGLYRGQVGTVVEKLTARRYEVEFFDNKGAAYAMASLAARDLIILHYHPLDEEAVA